ncbi:PLAC8 family protein [Aspergillus udagawae]|uniref:PLAC8 family protein n=1 Tax=Aspergillus udagawae TaxID=91492 RepID=A0A8H3S7J9_9EURO|nr:PLAC8 family protein [Aspergillus udagawae]
MTSIDKTYRSMPTAPTDHQAKSDVASAITRNPNWNFALFDCCSPGSLFLALGYCHWIIQTIRRSEMRQKHGIEGSCPGDCCVTFWCGCCALIQEEKEMELRTRPELTGYQSTAQMAYPS